jgi:hypothetical protein
MNIYGIENVRGGSYSQLVLSDAQISEIQKKLATANDLCYSCNKKGHFIKDCNVSQSADFMAEYVVVEPTVKPSFWARLANATVSILENIVENLTEKQECQKCRRTNHDTDHCYAKTDVVGNKL